MLGKFITIEGTEGVGKSTQIDLIKEYCKTNDINAVFTREPGGVKEAEKIRQIILDKDSKLHPLTELLMYLAARSEHLDRVVMPALRKGKTVFCDRFSDSTIAYQGYGRGLYPIQEFCTMIPQQFNLKIDLTLFLDLPPEESFKRKGGIDYGDRIEKEGLQFHERVYLGFKELALLKENQKRIVTIDASGEIKETHERIMGVLKERGVIQLVLK
ncbi:MAG: dTMP kinase [Firmicutes bacterium]|nr:dTMP kinase [Bacillota bacterium]